MLTRSKSPITKESLPIYLENIPIAISIATTIVAIIIIHSPTVNFAFLSIFDYRLPFFFNLFSLIILFIVNI